MKIFIDRKKRQVLKTSSANVALDRLVLKRRDLLPLDFVFCENGAEIPTPTGTAISCAVKLSFSAPHFAALAAGAPSVLDLHTLPIETAFAAGPPSVPAFLEVRWTLPGETTRTATLQVELQNSVILGNEGTPEAIPDGKATQAEAEAGTDNEKWMTPLRTAQATAGLSASLAAESAARASSDAALAESLAEETTARQTATATLQASLAGKAPLLHTHTSAHIEDFAQAVAAASPPPSWGALLGKPTVFPPAAHGHATDLDALFLAAQQAYYHDIIYTVGGDVSAIEVFTDSTRAVPLYTRTITYDGLGNITTVTTIDEQTPTVSLTKTITYNGSGDITNLERIYTF